MSCVPSLAVTGANSRPVPHAVPLLLGGPVALPHRTFNAAVFVALAVCSRTADAATVIYEYNNPGTAAYSFTTIPAPMAGDLGESASYFGNVEGAGHATYGQDPSALVNGDGASNGLHTTSPVFFFANDASPARLLMSWDGPRSIQEVRTFSWHDWTGTARAAQRYTLYGTNAAVDPNSWTYNPSDWTELATVYSGSWSGHPFQTAVSIQGVGPGGLGTYQHLLWDTTASNYDSSTDQHTVWREFDVLIHAPVNSGGLLSNGNFEMASGDPLKFNDWTYNGAVASSAAIVQSGSVLAGTGSAEIVRSGARSIEQQAAEALATFAFEMDFAVFPVTDANRSMNVLLREGASASSKAMNLRVAADGQLQVFDGSGSTWQAIGSLAANTTPDTGLTLEWNGEDPVMNHLEVVGYLSDLSDRHYNVTLNGSSVYGLRWFSGISPATISHIQLNGASSASNWVVDNISFGVPEPSSTAMLAVVFLLTLAPWRRKRSD